MSRRLEPVKEIAKMTMNHLEGIIKAIVPKVSNGPAKSINSRIKTIKIHACGFCNKDQFVDATYFHLGELERSPKS